MLCSVQTLHSSIGGLCFENWALLNFQVQWQILNLIFLCNSLTLFYFCTICNLSVFLSDERRQKKFSVRRSRIFLSTRCQIVVLFTISFPDSFITKWIFLIFKDVYELISHYGLYTHCISYKVMVKFSYVIIRFCELPSNTKEVFCCIYMHQRKKNENRSFFCHCSKLT